MEKILYKISYIIVKIFNILIGVPLAFAFTLVVLSICLVDLMLLLLPLFLMIDIIFSDIVVIGVTNNLGLQLIVTIVGTLMGYYLCKILKVYVQKWFKWIEEYTIRSFRFYGLGA